MSWFSAYHPASSEIPGRVLVSDPPTSGCGRVSFFLRDFHFLSFPFIASQNLPPMVRKVGSSKAARKFPDRVLVVDGNKVREREIFLKVSHFLSFPFIASHNLPPMVRKVGSSKAAGKFRDRVLAVDGMKVRVREIFLRDSHFLSFPFIASHFWTPSTPEAPRRWLSTKGAENLGLGMRVCG